MVCCYREVPSETDQSGSAVMQITRGSVPGRGKSKVKVWGRKTRISWKNMLEEYSGLRVDEVQ